MKTEIVETTRSKPYISKSNDYINSPKKLTAAQRNVLNVILTKVKVNSNIQYLDFQLHEISDLMGIKVTNFEQFREVFRSMKDIEIVGMKEEGLGLDNLIGETIFLHNNMGIRFYLTNLARQHFVQLKGKAYTKQLLSSSIFQSVYVHEIWDLICSIKNQRVKSKTIALSDLRNRMMLESSKYNEFGNFRKKVLDIAKNQINERTGVKIDYQPLKIGRNIVAIKFVITSIDETEKCENAEVIESIKPVNDPEERGRIEALLERDYKFSKEEVEQISALYPAKELYKVLYSIKMKKGTLNEIKQPERHILKQIESYK